MWHVPCRTVPGGADPRRHCERAAAGCDVARHPSRAPQVRLPPQVANCRPKSPTAAAALALTLLPCCIARRCSVACPASDIHVAALGTAAAADLEGPKAKKGCGFNFAARRHQDGGHVCIRGLRDAAQARQPPGMLSAALRQLDTRHHLGGRPHLRVRFRHLRHHWLPTPRPPCHLPPTTACIRAS